MVMRSDDSEGYGGLREVAAMGRAREIDWVPLA